MRELKFRICHTAHGEKSLIYPGDKSFFLMGLDGVLYENYGLLGRQMFESVFDADCALQQFTGLLDKNGKEIYEGDVIRETWESNNPYGYSPDKWREESREFMVFYKAPSFNLRDERSDGGQYCVKNFEREVVGNIFENPDLLK